MRDWDWDRMVAANRGKLLRLLVGLVALLGTGPVVRRVVWRRILARLVPMESAVRRLICIEARDLPEEAIPAHEGGSGGARRRGKRGAGKPAFVLTDRPRRVDPPPRGVPRDKEPRATWLDEVIPRDSDPCPRDDDPLDAGALRRRLEALQAALDDLPAQARRLMRWQARNARARKAGRWRPVHPFRMGRPPGHRERNRGEAHGVLADCHDLVLHCLWMRDRERRAG